MHHQEEDQEQLELKQLLGRDPDSRNIEIGDIEVTHLQLDSSQLAELAGSGFDTESRPFATRDARRIEDFV
jgi:hypothetical protein